MGGLNNEGSGVGTYRSPLVKELRLLGEKFVLHIEKKVACVSCNTEEFITKSPHCLQLSSGKEQLLEQ